LAANSSVPSRTRHCRPRLALRASERSPHVARKNLITEQLNASHRQIESVGFAVRGGNDRLDRVAENAQVVQAAFHLAFRVDHVACRDRVSQPAFCAVIIAKRDGRFEWPVHRLLPRGLAYSIPKILIKS